MEEETIYFIVVLIAATCLIFNILTISIILVDRNLRKQPSNYPIICFLLASALQGIFAAPLYVYKKLEHNEHLKGCICDAYRVPYFFCGHVTKISLLIVSLDRLLAVRNPFKYQKRATKRNMIALLAALCITTLIIDMVPLMHGTYNASKCNYIPTRLWGLFVIVTYNIIPFCLIAINYALIWSVAPRFEFQDKKENDSIRQHQYIIKQDSNNDTKTKNGKKKLYPTKSDTVSKVIFALEMKATKTSLALLAVYLICWGPLGIFYMIDHFCYNCLSRKSKLMETRAAIKLLCFSSCLLAPMVYCWWNKDYRTAAKKIFKCCCYSKLKSNVQGHYTVTTESQRFIPSGNSV